MRRTLVTSFEPFAGRDSNISAMVAEDLKQRSKNLPLNFAQLPVTYKGAFLELKKLQEKVQPEVIVLLGEALGSPGLRLERYAHNWCFSSTADNDGVVLRGEKVNAAGPECLVTTLSLPDLLVDGRVHLSLSAGAFVCNHVYYQALLNFSPVVACLFVHVTDSLSMTDQAELLNSLLEKLTLSDSEVDRL